MSTTTGGSFNVLYIQELESKVERQKDHIRNLEIELQILSDAYDDAVEIFGKDKLSAALLSRLSEDELKDDYEPLQY